MHLELYLQSIEGEGALDPRDLALGGVLPVSGFEAVFDVSEIKERNISLREWEKDIQSLQPEVFCITAPATVSRTHYNKQILIHHWFNMTTVMLNKAGRNITVTLFEPPKQSVIAEKVTPIFIAQELICNLYSSFILTRPIVCSICIISSIKIHSYP